MPWGRLDDRFYDHPKILAVGLAAAGLYSRGLSYCAGHPRDGLIPKTALANMPGFKAAAQRLVDGHLWEDLPDDYRVHDYLDWNPSRDQVLRDRQAAAERKRFAGKRPESGSIPDAPDSGRTLVSTPLHSTPGVPSGTPQGPPNPPRRRGARRGARVLSESDRADLEAMQASTTPLAAVP